MQVRELEWHLELRPRRAGALGPDGLNELHTLEVQAQRDASRKKEAISLEIAALREKREEIAAKCEQQAQFPPPSDNVQLPTPQAIDQVRNLFL